MKLNNKFRTFMFSNILLGAMAFNNWADDDFRNEFLSGSDAAQFGSLSYTDEGIVYTTKDGKEEVLKNWTVMGLMCRFGPYNVDDFIRNANCSTISYIIDNDYNGFYDYLKNEEYTNLLSILQKDYKCIYRGRLCSEKCISRLLNINQGKFLDLLNTRCDTSEKLKEILGLKAYCEGYHSVEGRTVYEWCSVAYAMCCAIHDVFINYIKDWLNSQKITWNDVKAILQLTDGKGSTVAGLLFSNKFDEFAGYLKDLLIAGKIEITDIIELLKSQSRLGGKYNCTVAINLFFCNYEKFSNWAESLPGFHEITWTDRRSMIQLRPNEEWNSDVVYKLFFKDFGDFATWVIRCLHNKAIGIRCIKEGTLLWKDGKNITLAHVLSDKTTDLFIEEYLLYKEFISQEVAMKILKCKASDDSCFKSYTVAHVLAVKNPGKFIKLLANKFDNESDISEILNLGICNGVPVECILADRLMGLLEKEVYTEKIKKILKLNISDGKTVAHLLAVNRADKFISLLMTKFSNENDISEILNFGICNGVLVECILANGFMVSLENKSDKAEIVKILKLNISDGKTVAYVLAVNRADKFIELLANKLDKAEIEEILNLGICNGVTVEHVLANRLMVSLGNKSDKAEIVKILKLNMFDGKTVAHLLAVNSVDNFINLLMTKFSNENDISEILRLTTNYGDTVAGMLSYCNAYNFLDLLNTKFKTSKVIMQILELKGVNQYRVAHALAGGSLNFIEFLLKKFNEKDDIKKILKLKSVDGDGDAVVHKLITYKTYITRKTYITCAYLLDFLEKFMTKQDIMEILEIRDGSQMTVAHCLSGSVYYCFVPFLEKLLMANRIDENDIKKILEWTCEDTKQVAVSLTEKAIAKDFVRLLNKILLKDKQYVIELLKWENSYSPRRSIAYLLCANAPEAFSNMLKGADFTSEEKQEIKKLFDGRVFSVSQNNTGRASRKRDAMDMGSSSEYSDKR